ncbi:MAG: hypothetical protein JNJ83_12475 [Verrucomicrobiaceae bacterium]|nr:hypothetical protein [Verrucomicrobiaceae bacterium]
MFKNSSDFFILSLDPSDDALSITFSLRNGNLRRFDVYEPTEGHLLEYPDIEVVVDKDATIEDIVVSNFAWLIVSAKYSQSLNMCAVTLLGL